MSHRPEPATPKSIPRQRQFNPRRSSVHRSVDRAPRLDLSKIRHDLRTPINHILGYCEMLQEDEGVPPEFAPDLARIHAGGKQLLALLTEYLDEETFETKRGDAQRLCHDLRTPINQIIGYSEILQEDAADLGQKTCLSDLQKIRAAAVSWLALMEKHLLPASAAACTPDNFSPPTARAFKSFATHRNILKPRTHASLLIVDDDEFNRDMLSRRLQRGGYTVQTASDGAEGLRLLRANTFDLVLLDLLMSNLDGYQVLLMIKSDPASREIPVIMLSALDQEEGIARCIEAGAEDYISKPFSPVFLGARIEASLERKRLRDQERQTYHALVASEQRLLAELAEAAVYIRSVLPAPIADRLKVQWRFQPSAELGGDAFGYHWLANGRFAIYLLDVSGHGVGAALLSVSVLNVIRAESLAGADFSDPASVLCQLNRVFQMDRHNHLIFSAWYGVFDPDTRQLAYASGGHPPAILFDPSQPPTSTPAELSTGGRLLGFDPDSDFHSATCFIPHGSALYVFSDGAYEISGSDGRTRQLPDLVQQLRQPPAAGTCKLDALSAWARNIRGENALEDDLSLIELEL